jgi:hypothetical protein
MTSRIAPPTFWLLRSFLLLAAAAPAAAQAPTATVQADRTTVQVGQPVLVTVRVRGSQEQPEVRPPAIDGATITPVGTAQSQPSLVSDLEAQGIIHAGAGKHFAAALQGLGNRALSGRIDPDLVKRVDPDLARMLNDPAFQKQYESALKSLNSPNQQDHIFTYQVEPRRAGPLVVPAFTVTSHGQTVNTKPLPLDVTDAKPQPWVRLALSLSNPAPLVGEEVELYVDLLIQRGPVKYNGTTYPCLPVANMALTVAGLDAPRGFELARPLAAIVSGSLVAPGRRGFRINSISGEMKLEHEPADGKDPTLDPGRYRRRLRVPLRLVHGGEVTIPAARAAGEVYVPVSGRGGKWEPFVVASEPLTFTILDLRNRPDRPLDFSGALGPLSVTSRASQTRMTPGTPFTLTVRLEGAASLAHVPAPDLGGRAEFSDRFRIRVEEERSVASNVREFTYTLRPLSGDVKEVPPVEVSYYHPKNDRFERARSEPIPLEVSGTATAPPPHDVPPDVPPSRSADTAAEPPAEETPAAQPGDGPDRFLAWAEGGLAVACGAGLGFWLAHRTRKQRQTRNERKITEGFLRAARTSLTQGPASVAEVGELLHDFLRSRFALPAGEVTPHDAAVCLRGAGVAEEQVHACQELLQTCAAAEFAPGMLDVSVSELADTAAKLIERLAAAPR